MSVRLFVRSPILMFLGAPFYYLSDGSLVGRGRGEDGTEDEREETGAGWQHVDNPGLGLRQRQLKMHTYKFHLQKIFFF